MKTSKIMTVLFTGLLAFAIQGRGQNVFLLTFKGTSATTNDAGAIVSQKLSNKTLIQDAVTATGVSNSASSLSLVYVQGASVNPSAEGDFVEVVSTADGTSIYTNLQFMYNGPFPPALTNAAGDQIVIGAQVVPLPLAEGDTLGGATINERIMPKKTVISGSFNYTMLLSPGLTNVDAVHVVNGTFNVGKPFVPK